VKCEIILEKREENVLFIYGDDERWLIISCFSYTGTMKDG
jgi:hypothetical protein